MIMSMKILKYVMFPGLKPRIKDVFMSGFQYVPYFIALVYQAVRLLPANHPYLNPVNFGRYGVRHVIAEAANNLVMSRKNIDQVILFFSILIGMTAIALQLCLLGLSFVFQPAFAIGFGTMFLTPVANQPNDIAGMMMDLVFGVPGIFNSCVSTAAVCADLDGNPITGNAASNVFSPLSDTAYNFFPFAMHQGLHQMLLIYNTGLLVVAAFVLSYFIVTVILETAQSGTPFGKRFNKVWAPIRLVVAFGLLIPINFGMNTSQYVVLYATKFGTGFANNGWILFNDTLTNSYLGDVGNLISRPNVPEMETLLQFFYVARTCAEGEKASSNTAIKPYLVKGPVNAVPNEEITPGTTYEKMMKFADGSTIVTISFGVEGKGGKDAGGKDLPNYGIYKGMVKPLCGQVKFNLTDPRIPGVAPEPQGGPMRLQQHYWQMLKDLWFDDIITSGYDGGPENYPKNLVKKYGNWPVAGAPADPKEPDADFKHAVTKHYMDGTKTAITEAIIDQVAEGRWSVPAQLRQTGWAGAGIWYNRIAEMNGPITSAVFNVPGVAKYPDVMEEVRKKKEQEEEDVTIQDAFDPVTVKGEPVKLPRAQDPKLAEIYNIAFMSWQREGVSTGSKNDSTGNIVIDTINLLFGTEGLFNMRENADVHPLAQLVGIGRSLVESTIRNLSGAALATLLQAIPGVGAAAGTVASLAITVAMIGLTVGFILFYIVPFLPFIYFFFSVSSWIKGIFEALLGAPLWALAHIRIDGQGFSGQAASQGYFLILEIFLRPILTVFGLLASISIFAALVMLLNDTFDLVLANLTGFDETCDTGTCSPMTLEYYRGPIDQFFFTVVYAVLVYIMAMASFKLIDQIPNNILRWMGSSAQAFNDKKQDPTEGLVGTASLGASETLRQLGGGLKGLTKLSG